MDDRPVVKMPCYLGDDGEPTCPKCGCKDTKVTHSYGWSSRGYERRRVCNNDQCRWVFPRSVEVFIEAE